MPSSTSPPAVDLLVLGATVAGVTAAVAAARRGARVMLLDSQPQTSFGLGLASLGQGDQLREIELHRGGVAVQTYVDQTRSATGWLERELAAQQVQMARRTAASIAVDGHLAFHLVQESRLLRSCGEQVSVTDRQLLPFPVRPALQLANQALVDPDQHQRALLRAAAEAGATVERSTPARRFWQSQGWQVRYGADATRTVHAAQVLDTVGVSPWGQVGFAGLLRAAPVVWTSPLPDLDQVCVLVDTPAALLLPQPDRLVVVGRAVPVGQEPTAVDHLLAWVEQHLPVAVQQSATRYLEMTSDRLPVVGRLPLPGAWVARGFGAFETTSATAAGLQVAAAVTHQAPLPWAPARLPHGLRAKVSRWVGPHSDPMVGVPGVLAGRGLA